VEGTSLENGRNCQGSGAEHLMRMEERRLRLAGKEGKRKSRAQGVRSLQRKGALATGVCKHEK